MKKSDMMIALAASLGTGAAAFYTMSKSKQPLNTAVENMTPLLNSIANTEGSGMSAQNGLSGNTDSSNQSQNGSQQQQEQGQQSLQNNSMN